MYSVVLMMALGGGAQTTGCHGDTSFVGASGVLIGGPGCHGGLFGCHGGGRHGGCHGGYGCSGCVGCYGCAGIISGPIYQAPPAEPVPPPIKNKQEEARRWMPGTIFVTLPEDARLTINGQPTRSLTATRVFESPPLEPGFDYVYNIEATVMRNGQPVPVRRQITVRAGQEARVSFTTPDREAESSIGEEQEPPRAQQPPPAGNSNRNNKNSNPQPRP